MPWLRVSLRGQKVLARVQADGAFVAEGGRVEIRYRATDPRVYRAAARNLERIDGEELQGDESVVAGEEVAAGAAVEKKKRSGTGTGTGTGTGKSESETRAVPAGAWTVYADGACSGNPGPAGLGVVFIGPDGQRLEGYEYLGTATNNIAELTAILRAAEIVPEGAAAVVHTDSQYSIGVLTKGWKAKANQELIASVKAVLATRRGWQIRYVPGHAGVPLNERADELAREAVQRRASRMPSRDGTMT